MIFKATIKPDFFDCAVISTNASLKKIVLEFMSKDCTITSISEKKVIGSKNKVTFFYVIMFTSTEHYGILKVLNEFKERVTFLDIEELK